MATKLTKIGSVPGMDVVRIFMEIVGDQEKYEAIISEIDEKTAEANARIELIAPANQIKPMHDIALAARKQAHQELRAAEDEAARLLGAAEVEVEKMIDEAREVLDNVETRDASTKVEKAEWEKEQAEAEKYIKEKTDALEKRESVVSQRETVLVAQVKAHEKRVERIDLALR